MRVVEDNVDKVANMKATYQNLKLDCLVVLGGNGTHKTANLLAEEGLNVIGLPKTIDNDIWDTDVTFGFHTAVDIATDVVDRIHTTATSHGRVMVIELMGNKAGWLTLYAGIAGGADVVLLPEIPYSIDRIFDGVKARHKDGKSFIIIAVAEGAMDSNEAAMKSKERDEARKAQGFTTVSQRIAGQIVQEFGADTRNVIPGHIQRGGSPSAYDRLLATRFGVAAAQLIRNETYGMTVALKGNNVTFNSLSEVAGKTKLVPKDHQLIQDGRDIGVVFGD